VESPDHPEVPGSLEHRREKQTRHKNRGERWDGGEATREMVEVQRPECEDDVADQDAPDGAPASNELGLQNAAVHQFLVKAPKQVRDHDRAHARAKARLRHHCTQAVEEDHDEDRVRDDDDLNEVRLLDGAPSTPAGEPDFGRPHAGDIANEYEGESQEQWNANPICRCGEMHPPEERQARANDSFQDQENEKQPASGGRAVGRHPPAVE